MHDPLEIFHGCFDISRGISRYTCTVVIVKKKDQRKSYQYVKENVEIARFNLDKFDCHCFIL